MFCKNCGAEIFENETYCRECGETVQLKEEEEELIETIEAPFVSLPEPENPVPDSVNNNKNIKTLFYILFIVILMILNTIACYFLFDNSEIIDDIKKSANKTIVETVTKYKYNYIGYQLVIPDDYIFEEIEGVLYITNKADSINMQVVIEKIPYWAITGDKDKLASSFVDDGYMIANSFEERPYHNKAFFVGELNYNNNNVITLYTQASETESFQMLINNDENNFDYSKIEEITSILADASFNSKKIEKDLLIEFPRHNNSEE